MVAGIMVFAITALAAGYKLYFHFRPAGGGGNYIYVRFNREVRQKCEEE